MSLIYFNPTLIRRGFMTFVAASAIALAVTSCGASRAAPAFPIDAGWYYLGPQPTPAQAAESLTLMVDGASDHRVETEDGERYDFGKPAVVYLEQPTPGVLQQREPSRIMLAGRHRKMHILGKEAGILVTIDGCQAMVGDGTYGYSVEVFAMRAMYRNPSFFGNVDSAGHVSLTAQLDPGNEWFVPEITSAKVALKQPLVLMSKTQLASVR